MSNPSEILDAQINAGWKHADAYDGDDRQDIKSDVFNAFQAGVVWERRRALEGRPSLEMAPWLGSIPAEESDEEFAKQIEDLDHQSGAQAGAVQRPADEDRERDKFEAYWKQRALLGLVPNMGQIRSEAWFSWWTRALEETQRSSSGARSNETSKPSQPEGS